MTRARPPVRGNEGFTLIELLLVIVLISIISTFAVTRLESIIGWKQEGDIRRIMSTWQLMFNESFARGEGYRLILNIDNNSYYVRREVHPEGNTTEQVDRLENLRSKKEKSRRAEKEVESLPSLKEEFAEEDRRQSGSLDSLYYRTLFSDPEGPVRLAVPLEFPALGEERTLAEGLKIRDVVVRGERLEQGEAVLRFSPRGGTEFAVVHMVAGDVVYTLVNDPATGNVKLHVGDMDFEWQHGIADKNKR